MVCNRKDDDVPLWTLTLMIAWFPAPARLDLVLWYRVEKASVLA